MNKINIKFILFVNFLFLYGCTTGVKEKIGIIQKSPDEFQVYKRKELSVPPNFDLRAPDSSSVTNEINNEEEDLLFSDTEKKELSVNDEILIMSVG